MTSGKRKSREVDMSGAHWSRGARWFSALSPLAARPSSSLSSLMVADTVLEREPVRYIAIAPNSDARFPRARNGEVGVDEGWGLAQAIRTVIERDHGPNKRPIITIVDAKSQAYGRREELLGIHLACAAAIDAYTEARMAGHPIIALIVGRTLSGAFLVLAGQANRILAFDSEDVVVQAMSKEAAARITCRDVTELECLGRSILPLAYDIRSFAQLGAIHKLISVDHPDTPTPESINQVERELTAAVIDSRAGLPTLETRLTSEGARRHRKASLTVREEMTAQWHRTTQG